MSKSIIYVQNGQRVQISCVPGLSDEEVKKHAEAMVPEGVAYEIVDTDQVPPDLAALIANKCRDLTADFALASSAPIAFTNAAGFSAVFQADEGSLSNVQKILLVFLPTQTLPDGYYWVAADNQRVPFTYADLQALAHAIESRAFQAFDKLQTLKATARAAQSVAELDAVVW